LPDEVQHQDAMRAVQGTEFRTSHPLYLGCCWIENTISEYQQGSCTLTRLRKRAVIFPERHFAAALVHLYVGTFSLDEIADLVAITPAELAYLRTQVDLMMLVDAAKTAFARHFRENLSINEYSLGQYASIAAEYATFEELARNQIRVPLVRRMQQQANSISNRIRHGHPVELHDLRNFKRLFSFFAFEKRFLQTLQRPSFEKLTTIAKEIVWHKLGSDYDALDCLLSTNLGTLGVKDQLRKRFRCLVLR
jgi:hypothetical protein